MHKKLIEDITAVYKTQLRDIELCKKLFVPVMIAGNMILEEAGNVPRHLYYISEGFMRLFYFDDNGDEVTTHINCPHGFFTSFTEFINQTKSSVNVETVTKCQLLRLSKQDYDTLMSDSPCWKDYGIYILQEAVNYNEERANDFGRLSAEQRYLKLMNYQPDIIQNVPLQYIASFLGIKPESLSRIRRHLIK